MKVAVVGASPKVERISNKAIHRLVRHGHEVLLVNPGHEEIEGLPVLPDLAEVGPGSVDTVTLYVNPSVSTGLREDLLRLRPRRVIFNPGSENPVLAEALQSVGVETTEACTLVLLGTAQF